MYLQSAIDALVARIGWAEATPLPNAATPSVVVDSGNIASASERTFRDFEALVIAEHVLMTMAIPNITVTQNPDNTVLNAYLLSLKKDGARKVLHRIFVANLEAKDVYGKRLDILGTDWTSTITSNIAAFDEAYGYQVAYDTLTMMLRSVRLNAVEKIIGQKGSIGQARDGFKTQEGRTISPGIFQKLEDAYAALSGVLFPASLKRPTARFIPM